MEGRGRQGQVERNEIDKLTQMKSKVNRLRRSPKAAPLTPGQTEFKTPTRPARGQFRRPVPDDSPSSDPDFHQDIIWDTTSPSPVRRGRGQRRAATVRAVDISDIANRIAPKNGRLEADSSLLQWIGDSAIPCTPEVQQPKVKTISIKQSTVEDLMRLAKQFDFNMRQDEAQERSSDAPGSKQSKEREPPRDDSFTAAHREPALKPNEKPVDERGLHQEMDDDLDFLFDGPTQRLSGRLSQASDCRTQEVPERSLCIAKASASQKGSGSVASENRGSKPVDKADDFDDDWNSDGLLDDSLLLEMTQNPDLFAAPQYSSTQKQTREKLNAFGAVTNKKQDAKSGTFQGRQAKSEQGFQQDSRIQVKPFGGLPGIGDHMENNGANRVFPTSKALPVPASCFQGKQNQRKMQVQQLRVNLNSSELNSVLSTPHFHPDSEEKLPSTGLGTNKPPRANAPSMHQNPSSGGVKQQGENAVAAKDGFSEALDEDLDSLFASDDIWDDGAEDDDLFCEACDDLEETAETPAAKALQNKAASRQTVFASVSTCRANTSVSPFGQEAPAVDSGPAGLGSNAARGATRPSGPSSNGACKFEQVRSSSVAGRGTCSVPSARQGHERGVLAVLQSDVRTADSHRFKKPHGDSKLVIAKDVCNSGAVRCSDAEIERKKQQAMERRRLRMLANQNLRAPV
ncbi:ewing's tumor-associated antigen 1 isoform X2 [Puntigrus tetrazona]|uniref:ewing's tumor-associated antigen 1 isoform X2 n=1 Tax=Puntigrus tetrazona TaxID=1606681 RepID=UPI001C8B0083|nr:ewing's tumor-associated antigen 1 isoform X2 [Puntigrus tetrazona]